MVVAVNLSRPPYFEKLHYRQSEYKIEVYADMVKAVSVSVIKSDKPVTGTKQAMKGLSDKSRHNMIEFLAKVEDVPDLFVTLTFSDDVAETWISHYKSDFELFRKQLEYHYPNVRAMWRIEFVPRKSGRLIHQFIPHFHLLVWLPKDVTPERKAKILEGEGQLWRNAWHKICHSSDENHVAKYGCKVEPIKSRKHAYAYCSKYLAKQNDEEIEAGRRWGRIGKFEHPIELETTLTRAQYIQFKRLLNAYLKAEAIKRYRNQKVVIPFRPVPLSSYLKFPRFFARMNVATGSSVFGLGFISQDNPIGTRTIYRLIRHARELAHERLYGEN